MTDDNLIRMTKQIAEFFAPYGHDASVEGIAEHIRSFWDPRMRAALLEKANQEPKAFQPVVLEAVKKLAAAR